VFASSGESFWFCLPIYLWISGQVPKANGSNACLTGYFSEWNDNPKCDESGFQRNHSSKELARESSSQLSLSLASIRHVLVSRSPISGSRHPPLAIRKWNGVDEHSRRSGDRFRHSKPYQASSRLYRVAGK
jgi:hypothetical protein